jgi:hypothetical protein
MSRAVKYGSPSFRQKDVGIFVDNGFKKFLKSAKGFKKEFWVVVERYFKKAVVILEERIKRNITSMNAVATGYMRKSIKGYVKINSGARTPITAVIGTKAWYDILVHEGLGRHSPSGKQPPGGIIMGPIVPSMAIRRKYWKPSPKVPRPFLKNAVKESKGAVKDMINQGFKAAVRSYFGNEVKGIYNARHKIESVLGGM